jgi:hypothetical protein
MRVSTNTGNIYKLLMYYKYIEIQFYRQQAGVLAPSVTRVNICALCVCV